MRIKQGARAQGAKKMIRLKIKMEVPKDISLMV
jgi:hypothetical protein